MVVFQSYGDVAIVGIQHADGTFSRERKFYGWFFSFRARCYARSLRNEIRDRPFISG